MSTTQFPDLAYFGGRSPARARPRCKNITRKKKNKHDKVEIQWWRNSTIYKLETSSN